MGRGRDVGNILGRWGRGRVSVRGRWLGDVEFLEVSVVRSGYVGEVLGEFSGVEF